jgi:hypothetical protein
MDSGDWSSIYDWEVELTSEETVNARFPGPRIHEGVDAANAGFRYDQRRI